MVERRQRVAVLKAQGLPHSTIGLRLGITTGTSERDFKQYKKEMKHEPGSKIPTNPKERIARFIT